MFLVSRNVEYFCRDAFGQRKSYAADIVQSLCRAQYSYRTQEKQASFYVLKQACNWCIVVKLFYSLWLSISAASFASYTLIL